jgi:hypothetical protein
VDPASFHKDVTWPSVWDATLGESEITRFWLLWLGCGAMSLPPTRFSGVANCVNYFFFGHFLVGLHCFGRQDLVYQRGRPGNAGRNPLIVTINSPIGSTI